MRSQQRLLLIAVVSAVLGTISAFSLDKKFSKNGIGLEIPSTGASIDVPTAAASLSQKYVTKLSNNQHMSYPTRRETIKMPSQTPMVPWKVRFTLSSTRFEWYRISFSGSISYKSASLGFGITNYYLYVWFYVNYTPNDELTLSFETKCNQKYTITTTTNWTQQLKTKR